MAYTRIPSFLITLARLGTAAGVAQRISGFQPVPILDRTFTLPFGSGDFGPVPSLLLWALVFVAVGQAAVRPLPVGYRGRAVRDRRGGPRRHQPLRRHGRVLGSVVGALFVGLINNGLILAGLDVSRQIIIQGIIIVIAVALTRKR